jgi:hypothetical protein
MREKQTTITINKNSVSNKKQINYSNKKQIKIQKL